MVANILTLAIYVDYQKAYDRVRHAALLTELQRLEMTLSTLKMLVSWLIDRKAFVVFGDKSSEVFYIDIVLPQNSSLSPCLFIVFHCDLVNSIREHSEHCS